MFFLLRTGAWFIGLTALAYVVVFVPLGQFTVWEHVMRISETDEAREFGRDVEAASDRVGGAMQDELRQLLQDEAEERQLLERAIDDAVGGAGDADGGADGPSADHPNPE